MGYLAQIKAALAGLEIPITTDFDGGGRDEYIVIREILDSGDDFGDDEPGSDVVMLQIHYFSPIAHDYIDAKREIRERLKNIESSSYPIITVNLDADLQYRDIVFEIQIDNQNT